MKTFLGCMLALACCFNGWCQVDTSYIYNTSMPYGTLDIRLAKSSTRYYYLQPNKTISFRESTPGVKTNTFKDMTNWDSSPYTEGNLREKNGTLDYFVMNYRLLFPNNYNSNYSPGYPIIIMMHGLGERANCWDSKCYHADQTWTYATNNPPAPADATHQLLNNDHNLLHGGEPHLKARNAAGTRLPDDPTLPQDAFPGFVLFPQNLNGWGSSTVHDAIRLIRLVVKKYKIDPDRIYIHGISNGAYGVYETIKRAPWLFAAALPMSGPYDANINGSGMAPKVAHIPLWIFQGGMDIDPKPSKTEEYVKKFRDAGAVVRYTKYAHLGHGVWNTAYKEPDFFSWMLSQRRSNLHVYAGVPKICNTNGQGARLQMPEGFRKYEWQKNGVTISGATAASYVATSTGTYRGRFSRVANPSSSDWNEWSPNVSVTTLSPAKAVIRQAGTALLRDLNTLNDCKFVANGEFDHYYWYKNGTKLSMSDTIQFATIKSTSGNGNYTLVVSNYDQCPSPTSDAITVFFSDTAPVNLTAPTNFRGTTASAASVNLNWTDGTSGEVGFEIWKRRVTGSSTYTPWSMSGITAPNATSFTDTKLEPSSTYHYKIRAVSKTGRSNYTPSSVSSYLILTTAEDNTAPAAPTNLTASQTGVGKITLNWTAATDNTGIREYVVYYSTSSTTESQATGSAATSFTLTGLSVNRTYSITVKARDLGGNLGASSNAAAANTYVTGLYYEHTTGAWADLDDINWNMVEYSGKTSNFSLSKKVQADYFNFRFEGYLYINTPGTYYFSTSSNEGSRLELGGVTIVENDGIHGTRTRESTAQQLTTGARKLVVKYFEYDGGEILKVSYKGPDTGGSWVTIPDAALKSSSSSGSGIEETEVLDETIVAAQDAFSVFPNPTDQSNIMVKVEDVEEGEIQIRLLDLSGREMYQQRFIHQEVRDGIRVQPNQPLQDGIYVVVVQDQKRMRQKKLAIRD
jgi:hypothetical protein